MGIGKHANCPHTVQHLTLFQQVRNQEELSVDATANSEIPLLKTVELLDIGYDQLWRHFLALRRHKGGKPLLKGGSQITLAEESLRLKFKAFSNWPTVGAVAPIAK